VVILLPAPVLVGPVPDPRGGWSPAAGRAAQGSVRSDAIAEVGAG